MSPLLLLMVLGCRQDMHDQPRHEPLEGSDFFPDGRASRPIVPDTVSREDFREDTPFYTGKSGGKPVSVLPVRLTRDLMLRGQERYDIFCAPCHGRIGDGRGMVVRRGFPEPPSFHIDRLRKAHVGYLYDVITNGFGRMPDYAAQIPVSDRWAIVAYLRALQRSQDATLEDVPADARARLEQEERRP